jgi:hypothetical protein
MSSAWGYIVAAYVVALVGLGALTLVAFLDLRRWAKRAKRDETP